MKRQLIGPAGTASEVVGGGGSALGLSVTAQRMRVLPLAHAQSASVAATARSMAELLPVGGGSPSSSSASSGGGVGKAALDMLCAMASSCGYERFYQSTTQQQQHSTSSTTTAAVPMLDPFEAYVYDTLYSNKGAVMARVAEALLTGADVVVRCPRAPCVNDDSLFLLPPLLSFARDSVMTDLPAMPPHQPTPAAAMAEPKIIVEVKESVAVDFNVDPPVNDDNLFFPTDAPTPTTPAPPLPLPLTAMTATSTAAETKQQQEVPLPSPPTPHAALSLLPQLYIGSLWPFVLHVASQPLLDYRQGPLGLIIGASQQQCMELQTLIGPLAEQLQLVVHNVFGALPLMPETRRADIVIGTAVRIASGIIPTNSNSNSNNSSSGVPNNSVEKVTERYYPTSCHFPSLPPTAAGTAAAAQAHALLAYEYYTLAHCSQLLIFEEGSSLATPSTSSTSLERAALERIVGSTHYSGGGGRNKGVLPTCQITLITNRADDDGNPSLNIPASTFPSSLFGLAALHYRKSEVAAALSLQGGGEGGCGEVVALDLAAEPPAAAAAVDSASPSPSRPSLFLGHKRARSSLLITAAEEGGDDEGDPNDANVCCRIGLTVHNVTTPSRWEQLGAGLKASAVADPCSSLPLHPAVAHLRGLVLGQWGEQCLKGSGVAVSVAGSSFGRFYGVDSTVGLKCTVVVRMGSGGGCGAPALPPLPLLLASLCQCVDGASLEPTGGDAMRFIMVAEARCSSSRVYHCSHKLTLDFLGSGGDGSWRCLQQQKAPLTIPRFPFVGDVVSSLSPQASSPPRFAVMIRGFIPTLRMVLDLGDDQCCAAGDTNTADATATVRAHRLVGRPLAELLSRLLLSSSSPLTLADGHAAVDSTAHVILSAMLGVLVGGASAQLSYPSSHNNSVINASLIYSLAVEQQDGSGAGGEGDADDEDLSHLLGGGEARFLLNTALCVQVPSWQSAVVLASQLGGSGGVAPPPIPVGPTDAGVRTYFALMQQMGIGDGRQLHYYVTEEENGEVGRGASAAHFTLASAVVPAMWAQQQGMVCTPMLI